MKRTSQASFRVLETSSSKSKSGRVLETRLVEFTEETDGKYTHGVQYRHSDHSDWRMVFSGNRSENAARRDMKSFLNDHKKYGK